MGGCCSKKPHVEVNKYDGFHLVGHMPTPKSTCDEKYFDKLGDNATFAVGSFWRAQAYFSLIPGVLRSRCGFSGGKSDIGDESEKAEDHIQVVDVEYDPDVTSYEQLLEIFWSIHDPSHKPDEVRYSSKIFYHTKEQKRLAEDSLMAKDREVLKSSTAVVNMKRVYTDIVPAMHIFLARKEDQQYYLQEDKYLMKIANCNTAEELAFSHLAAKLNAFCSGFATLDQFESQLQVYNLDLDDMAIAYIREKIKRYPKLG